MLARRDGEPMPAIPHILGAARVGVGNELPGA
jgi:hypothetical protein